MSEPMSATALAVSGVIVVAGVSTGLPSDMLLPAFVGSLIGVWRAQEGPVAWRVLHVAGSTLAAAWAAPVATGWAVTTFSASAELVKFPLAWVLGWGGLKFLLPRAQRILEGGGK